MLQLCTFLLFVGITGLYSCGDDKRGASSSVEDNATPFLSQASEIDLELRTKNLPVAQEIRKILDDTSQCSATLADSHENCEYDEIGFERSQAKVSSLGQRVMVIDYGPFPSVYTRLHNRTLDYVEINQNGEYKTTKKKLSIIRVLKKIYRDILGDKYPGIHGELLTKLGVHSQNYKFREGFRKVFTGNFHGDRVLSTMAEYSPQAEFVVAEAIDFNSIKNICKIDLDVSARSEFLNYLDRAVYSLSRIIGEYKIEFVNYSAGETLEQLSSILSKKCGRISRRTTEIILQILLEKFYKPLCTFSGVIFVQAGVISDSRLVENDSKFITDCAQLSNRLRVQAFLNTKNKPITGNDEADIALLTPNDKAVLGCSDIYLNVQLEQSHHPFRSPNYHILKSAFGVLGFIPFKQDIEVTPSWITPIATSHLIYTKRNLPTETPAVDLIASVNNFGRNKLIDPGFHLQFEVFRLNMLPISNCELLRIEANQLGLITDNELWNMRERNKAFLISSDKTILLYEVDCKKMH